jgi:GH35 family endo-1,4-beta-xylanase
MGLLCLLFAACTDEMIEDETAVVSEASAVTASAIAPAIPTSQTGCGYQVTSGLYSSWPGGYQAWVDVTNVSGANGTKFTVLLDSGDLNITDGYEAVYTKVEHGYKVTEPSWLKYNPIKKGKSYRFAFIGSGVYTGVSQYVISINDAICDQTPPTVDLSVNQTLFTSDGTLTLTATASDNIAVRKVVFKDDDEVIAVDWAAPFTADVSVTGALNGRHTYTATAVDPTGNEAGDSKRVFVAVGNRFFGTATAKASDYEGMPAIFNQITPGNAGKWGSVEATRDVMVWTDLDVAYQFAKDNGFPFKLHTLVWGAQQPSWLQGLPAEEQLAEIDEWMTALAERYPDVAMIDVVNEPLHSTPSYKEALGGDGETGWDWVIKAFEMARIHFPKAELILNDYNTLVMEPFTNDYLEIISILQAGDLIDGIGEQGHFLERAELDVVAADLAALAETGLPIYISELDVNFEDDARQAERVRDLVTLFTANPSVVGITHWGWRQGNMWQEDAYLSLTDGTPRPSLTWLECYLGGGTDCPVPEYVPQGWHGGQYGLTLEAELYDEGEGLLALGNAVAYTDAGDWLSFIDVDFKDGWDKFSVTYAKGSQDVGSISIHLDSLENAPVLTVPLPPTAGWGSPDTINAAWPPIEGTHTVYVRFNDVYGVGNVDKIWFGTDPPNTGANLVTNGDFEADGLTRWSSWTGAPLAISSAQAFSGDRSLFVDRGGQGAYAVYSLTGLVSPGVTYPVSVRMMHTGAAQDTLRLSAKIECSDPPAGHNTYPWLQNLTNVQPGVWTELSANLVIPDCNIVDVAIFFEGTSADVDVYIDAVKVVPPDNNLVVNGDFETANLASWSSWTGAALSVTDTQAYTGEQSLLVNPGASGQYAVYNLTGLVYPAVTYKVSVRAMHMGAGPDTLRLSAKIQCADPPAGHNTYPWLKNVTNVQPGVWTELSADLAIPDCEVTEVRLFFEGLSVGAPVYIDALKVTPPGENLLTDGGFESGTAGWSSWTGASLSTSTVKVFEGTKSMFVDRGGEGQFAVYFLNGFVQSNTTYAVKAHLLHTGAAPDTLRLTAMIQCVDPPTGHNTYQWLQNKTNVEPGVWTELSGNLVIPNCTIQNVAFYFEGTTADVDVYVDAVFVTPV